LVISNVSRAAKYQGYSSMTRKEKVFEVELLLLVELLLTLFFFHSIF